MNTRKTTQAKAAGALTLVLIGGAVVDTAQAAIQVELNGQPLNTSVAPVKIRERTVVPMRDIFEALGATVIWDPATQAITAQKDSTTVDLGINNRRAAINGRTVLLDQPATLLRGRTMVPLRFVSEAMGADVKWNDALQLVSINTGNTTLPVAALPVTVYPGAPVAQTPPATQPLPQPVQTQPVVQPAPGSQVAGVRYISVPPSAVVPVSLDQGLSSATSRVGDAFTATILSQRLGDSEFPAGTKLEGRVVESKPRQGDEPGVLDLELRSALLPDNSRIPIRGELIGLDRNSVVSDNGRIVAKANSGQSTGDKLKIVGIGAGAGFVLGRVLKTNTTLTTVLGAAGGYLYSRSRDKNRAADATLSQNTRLGVRLTDGVTYADTANYAPDRETFLRTSVSQSILGVPTIAEAQATTYQPNYQPPANQPVYTQPVPNQPVYQQPAAQPNYQPAPQTEYAPVTQPNYPPYTAALPAQAPANNNPNAYPPVTYQQGNQGPVDLGQPVNPNYPPATYPQQGYPVNNPQPGYQNYPPVGAQTAGYRTIRIPGNVVVPVTLDQDLSSATARVGQTFTATINSERIGDSEFPAGTKIEGIVTESVPRRGDEPGILDLDFRTALLPDGTTVPLNAQLISLDDKDLTQSSGRIVAKAGKGQGTGDKLKIVGIGAGVGFVLGKVLKKNSTVTAILGAAGGFLYSQSKKSHASEAVVTRGTKLGVRLDRAVAYRDQNGYADYRTQYLRG